VIGRIAIACFCAIAGAALLAQSPFDPALERQLWKKLLPMGGDLALPGPNFVPVPRRTSVNTPSPFHEVYDIDENGLPIYVSVTDPLTMPGATPEERAEQAYNVEVDLLRATDGSLTANQGKCTYSNFFDTLYDNLSPQWRQCVDGNRMVPPPPGALVDPVGLAVDGTTVYVVDDQNNRVQAFDFDGHVKPMKYPIGNGIPGSGTYSYSNYFPYATFPGYETFDGGYSGSQLNAPNGLAVDASHTIVVADSANHRLAMFASDGSSLFNFALPAQLGNSFQPTLVAITPGATVLPPGSQIPAGHESDRIVVTDWGHCMVQIYKTNFDPVITLPENLPDSPMHDACKSPDSTEEYPNGTPTFAGEFSTVTGVTVDQSGHIYVTDNAQNVVQVFDTEGTTLGWIGKPGVQPAPGEILGPVGVAIDHLGRVGVIDAGNSRVVFYDVAFDPTSGAPTATFDFQLDTVVSVGDFPMGLAEQWGPTAAGLDPKGRYVATDPWGKQILRFELPEIGIVDAQASILAQQPDGQPDGQLTGRGTFKVAVPRQKDAAVKDVETFVEPQEAGVTILPGSLTPGNDQVPAIDIAPGEYVAYEFLYTTTADVAQATFKINAHGDFDGTRYLAESPVAEARSRSTCTTCDATHEIYWLNQVATPGLATPITNPTTGTWYPAGVSVRIHPVPADGSVTAIGWSYGGASSVFYTQHADPQETTIGPAGYIDVPVGVAGSTTLTYFAVTNEGSIGAPHVVDLNIDLTPPAINFLIWPPYTGGPDPAGQQWYNHDISIGYVASDTYSGTDQDTQANPAVADGQLAFTAEGRNQSDDVTLTDRAGHQETFNSRTSTGGHAVNIDKTAPVFDFVPPALTVVATGHDELGGFAVLPEGALSPLVHDPDLADGSAGSGVIPLAPPADYRFRIGPNTWTYTATDYAGNTTTATTIVTVTPVEATIIAADRSVRYGDALPIDARVLVPFASGKVTFSFGPYTVSGYVVGEVATALIPAVLTPVGTYTMTVRLTEDPAVGDLETTATVTVTPAIVNVTAHPASKIYGSANPVFTATVVGAVNNEAINYSLTTTADQTTGVGSAPITVTFGSNPNYQLTKQDALLTINPRPATIAANSKSRVYGAANPPLDATVSNTVNGDVLNYALSTTAVPLSNVGGYPITVAPGSNPNYVVTPTGGTLTITRAPITVTPTSFTITYGGAQPPLTFSYSGFPQGTSAADISTPPTCTIAGAHTNAGTYPITCSGGAATNFSFVYATGTLTINPKPASITAASGTKVYGAGDPTLTPTPSGFLSGDLANLTFATTRPANENVGSYATSATVTGSAAGNYQVTVTPGTFTITKATPTISVTGGTVTYDAAAHGAACTVTGANSTDVLTGVLTYAPGGSSAPVGVGTYTATCTFAETANYKPVSGSATITINKKPVTVTANDASKVQGDPDPVLTAAPTAFVASDNIVVTLSRAPGEAVGTYAITPLATGAKIGNYLVTYVNGVFTIKSSNKPPTCSVATGGEIWPPNHKKFYAAPINGVKDPEGGPVTIVITGIWQDEPIDSDGDGQFSPDGQGVGTSTAWVRAERNGHQNKAAGDGRVYEILYKATDNKGASCTGSVFYTVPHDQGQRSTAIDSGVRYDSTGVIPGTRDKNQIHQNSPQ
jgi:hypothetical protein